MRLRPIPLGNSGFIDADNFNMNLRILIRYRVQKFLALHRKSRVESTMEKAWLRYVVGGGGGVHLDCEQSLIFLRESKAREPRALAWFTRFTTPKKNKVLLVV